MKGNVHAGVGAGRNRRPFLIREYLAERGTNMAKIADALGVSRQAVQATVRGIKNNRKVLKHLKEMGCPEKHLSLPQDLRD
ncbi:hypothetical protein [uncultured Pseudodesulfovibrio sp.]|uniref:hypothetical protein n=1 Tax=uncultured Pseudodesulfovibrio sp. TaxID=2035858 RepID=UPI0029C723E3|nr:hypothetical protein [uncultured Pseudodesulfovibrio sp.]